MREPEILYEDDNIIVVVKPAGMATQSANVRQEDLVSWTAKHRARQGEPTYVGLLSRLDQPVEGIVVLAKEAQSAAALTRQIEDKTLQKFYLAVVCHEATADEPGSIRPEDANGWITLEDYLAKNPTGNTSHVADRQDKRAKRAVLRYHDVTAEYENEREAETEWGAPLAICDIRLTTGRHHQIRVQLSHAGLPIAGDTKYGMSGDGGRGCYPQLGLFAYHVQFRHPRDGRAMEFTMPEPLAAYGFHKKTVIE